ncbi:hypothetical protein [Desulfogranum japonicum]|uniref:hypothetical protein n=1 Tax=Desulfogranum japonicum TaxID=231447 RepID=UPI0003F4AECB|nr:hypothetical protein [Desulfogranum japonicum]
MTRWITSPVQRLAETAYVRSAMEEQADLSAFKQRPTPRIIAGVSAIGFSYLIGWPAVTALGILAVKFHNHWIATIGGPLTYGLSHLVFMLGMYLAGAEYTMIFFRWLTRLTMEKLLS